MPPRNREPSPVSVDEQQLVEGCRAGDRAAFERFCREHLQLVLRVVGRVVGPSPDLEDLAQQTLIEAMRSFPRYRGEARLSIWLTRIGVHVAYHHLRSGNVRRAMPLELVPAAEEPVMPGLSPDEALDEARLTLHLYRVLDGIKPKKRTALLLYVVAGHSVEEIAALTGASRTAVKSRLFFARRELQVLIAADAVLSARARHFLVGEEG